MKFEAVTIKDIAKALGLSTSTVSRALRDSYEISSDTKKLVMDYAEKINYHPNPIALSLKERRTYTIGVLVCEVANSFFSQAINGIESVAHQQGYNVIIAQSHESFEKEVSNLQYLTSRSIDGLIVSVSFETHNFSHFKELHERGLPIVFFDRIVNEIETHKVIVDNFKGTYDATVHLLSRGYKRIAALAFGELLSISHERIAGYKAALADNGIEINDALIKHCKPGDDTTHETEQAVYKLLEMNPRPDAILGLSDKLTTGTLRILMNRKIKIPDEIAVAGFSNSDLCDILNPSLTIVRQPAFQMGEVATRQLLQLIESKRPVTQFETRVLTPELMIRESSKKKRNIAKVVS